MECCLSARKAGYSNCFWSNTWKRHSSYSSFLPSPFHLITFPISFHIPSLSSAPSVSFLYLPAVSGLWNLSCTPFPLWPFDTVPEVPSAQLQTVWGAAVSRPVRRPPPGRKQRQEMPEGGPGRTLIVIPRWLRMVIGIRAFTINLEIRRTSTSKKTAGGLQPWL